MPSPDRWTTPTDHNAQVARIAHLEARVKSLEAAARQRIEALESALIEIGACNYGEMERAHAIVERVLAGGETP